MLLHVKLSIYVRIQRCIASSNQFFVKRSKSNEILLYLQQQNLLFMDSWTSYQCPNKLQISKSEKDGGKKFNLFDLSNYFINKTTGEFTCPANGHAGTWSEFKAFNNSKTAPLESSLNCATCLATYESSTPIMQLEFNHLNLLLDKFGLKDVNVKTLSESGVRTSRDELVLPFWNIASKTRHLHGIKLIHSSKYGKECGAQTPDEVSTIVAPQKQSLKFFGLAQKDLKRACVVITANELDAIAVNSLTQKYTAIALPFGTSSLPLNLLPYVEPFPEIILWFGASLASVEASQIFAKKLGMSRCRAVRCTAALHALQNGVDVNETISNAVSTQIKNIITFHDLRSDVCDELMNADKFAGVPYKRFIGLNKKIKGHRKGELSILTGPTGSGKTTLLSELSLDLAMQGVRTLWGSFEVSNKRLLVCMFKQFNRDFQESFEQVASKFQELPLTFMTYSGPQDIDDVMRTMYEVTYSKDIHHIVIDNLQFMMGSGMRTDRFLYQDLVVGKFREFATRHHVHVTIVVHPRKEDHNLPMQLSSVFGSAKVTQESDNVFIIQQSRIVKPDSNFPTIAKYLEVAKNRYDGELGKVKLHFNKNNKCMSLEPIA